MYPKFNIKPARAGEMMKTDIEGSYHNALPSPEKKENR